MSARVRRRRARAEALPETPAAARVPARRLPTLPLVAGAAGLALIGTAWTTRLAPGPARASTETAARFTVEIVPDQQRIINSWQRFFICYDLVDTNIIDSTLRANLRATGSLQFPGDKVEVELPAAGAARRATGSGGAEDELNQVRQSVIDAVTRDASAPREQCAGGVPVPAARPARTPDRAAAPPRVRPSAPRPGAAPPPVRTPPARSP